MTERKSGFAAILLNASGQVQCIPGVLFVQSSDQRDMVTNPGCATYSPTEAFCSGAIPDVELPWRPPIATKQKHVAHKEGQARFASGRDRR